MTIASLVTIEGDVHVPRSARPVRDPGDGGRERRRSSGIGTPRPSRRPRSGSTSDGLELGANLDVGASFGHDLGLSLQRERDVHVQHGAGAEDHRPRQRPRRRHRPGFLLSINGEIDFIGIINASGSLTIAINQNAFTLDFNVALAARPARPHRERLRRRLLRHGAQRRRPRAPARRRDQLQPLRHHQDQGQRPDPAEHDAAEPRRERDHDQRELVQAAHRRHGQPARRDQAQHVRRRDRRRRPQVSYGTPGSYTYVNETIARGRVVLRLQRRAPTSSASRR